MNNLQELIIRDQVLIIPICKGKESKEDQDHGLFMLQYSQDNYDPY